MPFESEAEQHLASSPMTQANFLFSPNKFSRKKQKHPNTKCKTSSIKNDFSRRTRNEVSKRAHD
jgi:hypothetical protein